MNRLFNRLARIRLLLLFQLASSFLLAGCGSRDLPSYRLDFSKLEPGPANAQKQGGTLRVAVSAMTSPQETFRLYNELVHFLGNEVGFSAQLVQRKSYREVNQLLLEHELDLLFTCTGAYLDLASTGEVELLAVPMIRGKTTYRSYFVVMENSTIRSFLDMENKRFAYTDSLSLTGCLFPRWKLLQMGRSPQEYFRFVFYTGGHDRSLQAVSRGIVDGACVDGLIYDYLAAKQPESLSNIRIVEMSEEFGMPPVVVSSSLSAELKSKLRDALLVMHLREEGQEILAGLMIDRFVLANDSLYATAKVVFQSAAKRW